MVGSKRLLEQGCRNMIAGKSLSEQVCLNMVGVKRLLEQGCRNMFRGKACRNMVCKLMVAGSYVRIWLAGKGWVGGTVVSK